MNCRGSSQDEPPPTGRELVGGGRGRVVKLPTVMGRASGLSPTLAQSVRVDISKDTLDVHLHPAAVYNAFNTQPHLIPRRGLRILRARAHAAWADDTEAA